MTTKEILSVREHRPWMLPSERWKYYQEWNNAVFLHWQVDYDELKRLVPEDLEIDLYEDKPWVSLVAFTMEKIRPRNFPSFSPISDFHKINIRTYVKKNNKTGVYFLIKLMILGNYFYVNKPLTTEKFLDIHHKYFRDIVV